PGPAGAGGLRLHGKRHRPGGRTPGHPGRTGPGPEPRRPRHPGRARRPRPAGARRHRIAGARRAARPGPGRLVPPSGRAAQRAAVHHGLPRRGTREPAPDHTGDERPAAQDGADRPRRSVQSWPPYLVPVETQRTGQTLHAWTMTDLPILCLAGPTASGKSATTHTLAQHWPIEIIVMDSATIYRDMDIGTAKPSAQEQAAIPHHLLDIRDPAERYSAAEFTA